MPRLVNQVAKNNLGGYDFPKTETWKYLPGTLDFPDSSVGKESACNAGDPGSIPGSERSAGEGIGYPLQYSGLENSMGLQRVGHDWATFTFTF